MPSSSRQFAPNRLAWVLLSTNIALIIVAEAIFVNGFSIFSVKSGYLINSSNFANITHRENR
jgi:hypothetical protein